MDILPETCYALVQLAPGLLPLLPRAAIAVVPLIAFWTKGASPPGISSNIRDPHFFDPDTKQLTTYAKAVLLAFVAWVGLRLFVVWISALVLWSSSLPSFRGRSAVPRPVNRIRDPASTRPPDKSWQSTEHEFKWEWRDRSRARIQDAFELCMMRHHPRRVGENVLPEPIPPKVDHQCVSELAIDPPQSPSAKTIRIRDFADPNFHATIENVRSAVSSMPNPGLGSAHGLGNSEEIVMIHRLRSPRSTGSISVQESFHTPEGSNTPVDDEERAVYPNRDDNRIMLPDLGVSDHLSRLLSSQPDVPATKDSAANIVDRAEGGIAGQHAADLGSRS